MYCDEIVISDAISRELRNDAILHCSFIFQGYRYVLTTYTGDRFGAGTDARVFAKLYGSKGTTSEKELESSGRDNFERGQ